MSKLFSAGMQAARGLAARSMSMAAHEAPKLPFSQEKALQQIRNAYVYSMGVAKAPAVVGEDLEGSFQAAHASQYRRAAGALLKQTTGIVSGKAKEDIHARNEAVAASSRTTASSENHALGPLMLDQKAKGKTNQQIYDGAFRTDGTGIVPREMQQQALAFLEENRSLPPQEVFAKLDELHKVDPTLAAKLAKVTEVFTKSNERLTALSEDKELKHEPTEVRLGKLYDAVDRDAVVYSSLVERGPIATKMGRDDNIERPISAAKPDHEKIAAIIDSTELADKMRAGLASVNIRSASGAYVRSREHVQQQKQSQNQLG